MKAAAAILLLHALLFGCTKQGLAPQERYGEPDVTIWAEQRRKLFSREARIAGQLHHGNLVDILDHRLDTERPYVVFQFIDGVDLRVLRKEAELSPGQVGWIGERVAAALHYAHSFRHGNIRGVLHRDVTPGNILVDTEGAVKLADFGLARLQTEGTASLTIEKELTGTVPYLAPEIVRGEPATERSDIYGLGAVLYELAVGRPPLEGIHHYELIRKIGEGGCLQGRALSELAPRFSKRFHALLQQMLAPDADDRPLSASEVQLRLQECGAGRAEGRALGKIVRQIREHAERQAPEPVLDALPLPLKAARQKGKNRPKPKARQRAVGATALLMLALASLFVVLRASDRHAPRSPSAKEPATDSAPATATVAATDSASATDTAPATDTASATHTASANETPAPPSRGRLVVYAQPWGNVWLDGEEVGRSPFRRTLRPGVYEVQVGDTYPEAPQRVRVASGKTREVMIRREALR